VNRVLAWDGCVNVRDLGGLATRDGGETRAGAVVRGDSPGRLTDDGWRALVAHGVRTVVDLRWPEERAEEPPPGVPVRVVHASLLGERDPDFVARIDEGLDGEELVAETYLALLGRYRAQFAQAAAAVADAEPGGVLVHCSAGKDRTGLVAALLLALAGVEADAIADDYAATEANMAELKRRWVEAAADEADRAQREARRTPTPRQAMLDVLAGLEPEGGAEGYLRAGGLDGARIERLRERLR
jgi:protein tyrosine/serine phosphatase